MAFQRSVCFLVFAILTHYLAGQTLGESRIVGGTPIQGQLPYQISLQGKSSSGIIDRLIQLMLMQSRSEWSHYCGGCIITEKHVLTAAHCMYGADETKISVLAGTSSRLRGGRRHAIESYVNHPDYLKLRTNDISIITVKEPFTFGPAINKIEFRDQTEVEGDVKVKLSGWGYTTPLATFLLPIGLRIISLLTISNKQCKSHGYNVSASEICTRSGILRGACMGDSGGPLVNEEKTLLIGLVSYGSRICGAGRPEVYTRISAFVPWIENEIGKVSSPATEPPTDTTVGVTSTTVAPTTSATTNTPTAASTTVPPLASDSPATGSFPFTPVGGQTVATLPPTTPIPTTLASSTPPLQEPSTELPSTDNLEPATEPAMEAATELVTEPTTELIIEPEIAVTPTTLETTIAA